MSDGDWDKGNFLIAADETLLKEQLAKLLSRCYCEALYRPENKKKLLKLRAHIAAIQAYQSVMNEPRRRQKLLKAA